MVDDQAPQRRKSSETLQGVTTALRALRLFAVQPQLGIREAARLLDVPPPVAQRLFKTLQAEGFISQASTRKTYSLAPTVLEMANAYLGNHDFFSLAHEEMEPLHRLSGGETVALWSESAGMRTCVVSVESNHWLRVAIRRGSASPIRTGAVDLVFRAFASPEELRQMDRVLEDLGEGLSVLPKREEMELIRQRGWVATFGASMLGTASFAAVVDSGTERFVVDVFGPEQRLRTLDFETVNGGLLRLAEDLARILTFLDRPQMPQGLT